MSCVNVQYIDGDECIGASLPKINGNFASLSAAVCGLSAESTTDAGYLLTLINTLSTNMQNIGNYPYLEYAWVTAPNAAGQPITANTVTTLTLNTEVADTGNFGSLSANQITLSAGTYQFEASVRVVNTAPDSAASILQLFNVSDSSFVSRTSDNESTGAYQVCKLTGQFTIITPKVFLLSLINTNQTGSSVVRSGTWGTLFTNSTANADQRTTIKFWKVG